MKKVWMLPIESGLGRYSEQWLTMFTNKLYQNGIPQYTIFGNQLKNGIENGEFLDVINTNYYKSTQLAKLIELISDGSVKDGDWILVHDGWFPGLESLFYIRDGMGKKFKIAICLHAGTWDPFDFLTKRGMGLWACGVEETWMRGVDKIFVATEFHKDILQNNRDFDISKVHVTYFPLSVVETNFRSWEEKEKIVVFPHRLALEKQPHVFGIMAAELGNKYAKLGWQFIKSKDVCQTKHEYYDLLSKSRIAVSCALQETWGIAQQESVLSGCLPVVPDRLSYPEIYPKCFRYERDEDCLDMIENMIEVIEGDSPEHLESASGLLQARNECLDFIIKSSQDSIDKMLQKMSLYN